MIKANEAAWSAIRTRRIESCVLKPERWLLIHYSNGIEFTHEERKASYAEEFLAAEIGKWERKATVAIEALSIIAHADGYDGSLCADKEECPNCYAQKVLLELANL